MEFVSVQESLSTFNKETLIGKFIKFERTADMRHYDLEKFTQWLDRHFIFETYNNLEEGIFFEVVFLKHDYYYCSPTGRL